VEVCTDVSSGARWLTKDRREWLRFKPALTRSDALHRVSGVSRGIGLAVFLHQGLTAWMRACGSVLMPSVKQVAQPAPGSSLPFDVRTQTVLILAGMLLGNRSEAN